MDAVAKAVKDKEEPHGDTSNHKWLEV